jgi:hypothetical protein
MRLSVNDFMRKIKNLENQTFERLTALRFVRWDKWGNAVWACRCSCDGKEIEVRGNSLLSGNTASCGCGRRELHSARLNGHRGKDAMGFKHGCYGSPEYRVWGSMVQRCTNPNQKAWRCYGGAGATVCDRWSGEHGFEHFLSDMGERPSSEHSLSRFGDIGNYEPGNVTWHTRREQGLEKRIHHQLQFLEA